MYRLLLLIFCFLCFFSCEQDDEMTFPPLLSAECEGLHMVGKWLVIDSIETTYDNIDSIEYNIYHSQMILFENGIGNLNRAFWPDDSYFNWLLQCDPDLFVLSTPSNNEDSIFNYSGLFSITKYEILINELDYKRLRREWRPFPTSDEFKTTYRELFKIP